MRGKLSENLGILTAGPVDITAGQTSTSPWMPISSLGEAIFQFAVLGAVTAIEDVLIIVQSASDESGTDLGNAAVLEHTNCEGATTATIDVESIEAGDGVILDGIRFEYNASSSEGLEDNEFEDAAGLAALIDALPGYTADNNVHVVSVSTTEAGGKLDLQADPGDTSGWLELATTQRFATDADIDVSKDLDGNTYLRYVIDNNTAGTITVAVTAIGGKSTYKPVSS